QPNLRLLHSKDDNSGVDNLIRVLSHKAQQIQTAPTINNDHLKLISDRVNHLTAWHDFTQKNWIIYCQISPGNALRRIKRILLRINPAPKYRSGLVETEQESLSDDEQIDAFLMLLEGSNRYGHGWVQLVASGSRPQEFESEFAALKMDLHRVYEAIRQK